LRGRVQVGDVFWFIRQLKCLGLPPSLDAYLTVERVSGDDVLTFTASDQSSWLPWRDATALLLSLQFGDGRLTVDKLPQQLQTTREIACAADVDRLTAFALQALARPRAFISYSWTDGRSWLPSVVRRLEALDYAAWFDLWSGPRRLSCGVEVAPDWRIRELLLEAIRQSDCFIELRSAAYGESCWVKTERAMAHSLDKPVMPLTTVDLDHFALPQAGR